LDRPIRLEKGGIMEDKEWSSENNKGTRGGNGIKAVASPTPQVDSREHVHPHFCQRTLD